MNMIYLVEMSNGRYGDDYEDDVEMAFTSYRKASQWLINDGYKPCINGLFSSPRLIFIKWKYDYYYAQDSEFVAEIREMKITE